MEKVLLKKLRKPINKMPKEVEKLWEKYGLWDTLKEHMKLTAELTLGIADILKSSGIKPNKDVLIKAALLHDIGKVRDKPSHPLKGRELLIEEGLVDIGEIIATHGYAYELTWQESELPKSWEEKVLTYADLHVDLEVRPYNERILDWVGRTAKNKKKRNLNPEQIISAVKRWNTLVAEINALIGVEEELIDINELKVWTD